MLYKLGVIASLLLFAALCWVCVERDGRMIAMDLRQTVSDRVNTAPMHGIGVAADGRQMTLTGRVGSDEDKARAGQEAAAVSGVSSVENDLTVAAAAIPRAAPAAIAPAAINARIARILLDKKIEFSPGTAKLLPASVPVLGVMLAELRKGPGLSVKVSGYTDNDGDAVANHALSEQRAQAVSAWLAQHGIESGRMHAVGFGPEHPIASNATSEGKAKNRRVEITTEVDNK